MEETSHLLGRRGSRFPRLPGTVTGRELFIKLIYVLRF